MGSFLTSVYDTLMTITTEDGALTQMYLATSPEVETGKVKGQYYVSRNYHCYMHVCIGGWTIHVPSNRCRLVKLGVFPLLPARMLMRRNSGTSQRPY